MSFVCTTSNSAVIWKSLSATSAMLVGLLIAFYAYMRNTAFPAAFVDQFGLLYRFLLNKWYFDETYQVLIVRPLRRTRRIGP